MKSVNPATGETIAEYEDHTPAQCRAVLQSVESAWISWRTSPLEARARILTEMSGLLTRNKAECAALITREMGKRLAESEAEIEKCALLCSHFADKGPAMLSRKTLEAEGDGATLFFEPLGPLLAVMPWNFPFWQVLRFAVPQIMAGNAVVLKHASNVPGCALALEALARESGLPENLFRSLLVPGPVAEQLALEPQIRGVTMTGSGRAGRKLAAAAGKGLKKCVMELGGSDPFIIFEDADRDRAFSNAHLARTRVSGQVCIAAKRFLVHESLYEDFLVHLAESFRAMVPGDPMDPDTTLGPLAKPRLVKTLHAQVQDSLLAGAELVEGGRPLDRPGYYYAPTVLAGCAPGMPAFDQETFGPLAAVTPFSSEEQAVELANATSYGLGASVWTENALRAERMAREIEAGNVAVNAMVASTPEVPFGGVKNSGFGRELGRQGMLEFVNLKVVRRD